MEISEQPTNEIDVSSRSLINRSPLGRGNLRAWSLLWDRMSSTALVTWSQIFIKKYALRGTGFNPSVPSVLYTAFYIDKPAKLFQFHFSDILFSSPIIDPHDNELLSFSDWSNFINFFKDFYLSIYLLTITRLSLSILSKLITRK